LLAEPVYVLTDTAIVGHLGTVPLAGLAAAASLILTGYSLCIFLAYGTTSAVARLLGAGEEREAAHQAVQGLWLALLLGAVTAGAVVATAPWLLDLVGAHGDVRDAASTYLHVSLPGFPALLLTLAGTGYLRGVQDTRTPLYVAIGTALLNLVLELALIPGLGYGIGASALATVIAQIVGAAVYVSRILPSARAHHVTLRPDFSAIRRLLVVGRDLVVRTAALRGALLLATATASRIGVADLGAHQVAFEIWSFLALGLDALAIAGQAMTGHLLGAGDADAARAAGRRLIEWGMLGGIVVAVLIVVLRPWLPHLFSGDPAVTGLIAFLLWWVAVLQPVNAVVFVLDGVLIGAGDQRFLAWAMVAAFAAFAVVAVAVLVLGLGIGWLWGALTVLMTARLVALGVRFQRGRWAVTGTSV
jgi:putative MATE family efflux protein